MLLYLGFSKELMEVIVGNYPDYRYFKCHYVFVPSVSTTKAQGLEILHNWLVGSRVQTLCRHYIKSSKQVAIILTSNNVVVNSLGWK